MKQLSFANRWNADLIDQCYEQWVRDPSQLDAPWQAFFEGFALAQDASGNGASSSPAQSAAALNDPKKQARVIGAIYAYRSIGHTQAAFNPLFPPEPNPRLALERLGFEESDLDLLFDTGNYLGGVSMTLRELLRRLHKTYCGSVGCEYLHIQETAKRRWLQARMEPHDNVPQLPFPRQVRVLRKLYEAEIFESFLHTRYVGQKRFSLEGAETLIPLLDAVIQKMPSLGMEEAVMGMAHRGRLNVLANIFGKSYQFIFNEFSENYVPNLAFGDGDVKYHLGYETACRTESGANVDLRLAANPSHLEAVNAVVEGKARARQRVRDDHHERKKVIPILIHGDAAIAGQGIVAEVLNFSKLKGYATGGTLHIVVNNQIGFTTDPSEARSSRYCTDVAKMVEAPIFHVNGDDPLACIMVAELALEYRATFGEDVFIDMLCYRKHGHNESDEPVFTQPLLYKAINQMPRKSETLSHRLITAGALSPEESAALQKEFEETLNDAFERARKAEQIKSGGSKLFGSNAVFQPRFHFTPVVTSAPSENLERVARLLTTVPSGFSINPKIQRQLDSKWKAYQSGQGLDWAMGELLAFGTLMLEGHSVRLDGQDSVRGTFSHRHAGWYDVETRELFVPLKELEGQGARFCLYNSLLSEAAVLGFDFGYSLDYPNMLAIWEAQFGDFANGAQVIIDQFICSSESKWQRVSNLVLLLPHGYEGQGPEHSSARLERFLQACAEENIQVCNFTTPANYFHALRRQMKRDFRKPLVVMAPKSLLRSPQAVSPLSDFSSGSFQEMIPDPTPPAQVDRLVLCSGKIYYDLAAARDRLPQCRTALVRIEQLYPLHAELLRQIAARYPFKELVWCQEEPENMGAWVWIRHRLESILGHRPTYAGRDEAASPATGSLAIHKIEQQAILTAALA